MADMLKAAGNAAIAAKNFDKAVEKFTQAIAIEPTNHILYSNRSAAYAWKKDYENALKDAIKVTEIKPGWVKGWGRKAAAMHGMEDLIGAGWAYKEGIKRDPNIAQQYRPIIAAIDRTIEDAARAPMEKLFRDPQLMQKLAANPNTSKFLADPSFMAKLQQLQENPRLSRMDFFMEPPTLTVMIVLMGFEPKAPEPEPED
ncbi:stress-induced-phosphoprotein 1 [Capronia coronata CBS 617.96]|uniref:Stress-induced-phosphoprotein 1 n=1 Tax=Capronia coronata CBS 617.96 TaxID=1182541 RepID=W9YDI2_9EURO|nr:stress-induced-phosphoprotein 1 [Capronia coronata CBS 617.96]EXJ80349.1 stress-induced-phosphoprotein 1 [Capronia coronata CBS 617.96]